MYGSNYGSSYGSMGSYGSYGAYNSPYGASTMMGAMRNQQNLQQPNNQQPPEQNEKYFKMMGGMRSMLELGFAGVAFYNFGSKAFSLFKKIILFLLKTSASFFGFLAKFIPVQQIKTVVVASTGSKSDLKLNNLLISIIRISVVALLAVSYKMRNSIKDQIFNKHQQLSKKAQQIEKKKETLQKNMQKYKEQSNL